MKKRWVCLISLALVTSSGFADSYTVTYPSGLSLIANHLNHAGGNTLNNLLPSPPDGTAFYKWNCGLFTVYTWSDLDFAWSPDGNATLNPGEGAFLNLPVSTTITFTGTPQVPILPVVLPCGCNHTNLLSRQTTNAPTFYQDLTGFNPTDGTTLTRLLGGTYVTYTFSGGAWSPATPALNRGESAFVYVPCQTNAIAQKWLQVPETTTNGIDVHLVTTLADDFRCTATGPITEVRIWGSWLNDVVFTNPCFCLGLWTDVPKSATNSYSQPGQLLCETCFNPTQYGQLLYTNVYYEHFWDPADPVLFALDSQVWEYIFTMPANSCWWQTNGNTYWLSLRIPPGCFDTAQYHFGWKTCPTNWNDDAVYGFQQGSAWQELRRPPSSSNSLDLAFQIITASNTCVPVTATGPTSRTNCVGTTATFTTTASGTAPIAYQWNKNGAPLPGATASVFSLLVSGAGDAGNYCVVVSNGCGVVTNCATLTVASPTTVNGPNSTTNCVGTTALFVAVPSGTGPFTYQWTKDGAPIAGATSTIYSRPVTGPGDAGTYCIVVAGFCNTVTNCATLQVLSPVPTLLCAADRTVSCGSVWSNTPPVVLDPCCGANYTITYTAVTNGKCPAVITYTWTVTNCLGYSAICTQLVTLVDTNPPVLICATNKTVQCGTTWTFDPPTAFDACCGTNVTISVLSTFTNNTTCPVVITRTWQAIDCCNNGATCSQTVTVRDTIPPVIVCPTNLTVSCTNQIPPRPATLADFLAAGGSAFDTCDANLAYSCSDSPLTGSPCNGTIIRTHTVTDDCTNSASCTQLITVRDTTPPTITCATNKTIPANTPWTFDPPTASDTCCGTNVTITVLNTVTNSDGCTLVATRMWLATDCCSNSATCSQTVTVPLGTNCCPTTNALVLNTGYNHNLNTVYGYGQADAFWWVTVDPTLPPTFLPRPATVIQPHPFWQPAQANSQWISSYPTEADNLNGEYDFETFFCVATNAANLVLNVCLRADDQAGAYLNGNLIPLSPPDTTWGAPVPACGTVINPSWFVPGLNVLLVRVTNVYAVAMGLNVEASVTGSGLSLIEQSAPCCRPNSGISGQKYYDLNNNGVHDPGEPALSGWTIHLSNGATAVTDGNGFYYFLGLVPGTYTVTETVQSGWTQTAPGGGSYTLTLGTAQQINGQDFGNYRPNNTNCVHIFDCPTNIVAQCTGSGGAVVAYSATATSSCTTNSVIVTYTPPSTTFFPVGTTVVHVTAIDSLDNWSTNCSFTVTVVDTLPPVITCPSNIVVGSSCINVPVFYTPTASDACCGSNVTVVSIPPSGSFFAPGTTTPVRCVATDCYGNSNSCTFTVTVPLGTNCCPTTNALVLNTGYNHNLNTVYGYGQADAFWWVTVDPTLPPTFLPRPATVIQPHPFWQPAQANSQWISSYPTEADNLNGEYDFETFFCVATNATNLVLNVCLRADDQAGAYLNGNLIPLSPPDTTWGAPVPACGTVINPSWFVPGLNVLLVRVTNVYAVAMGLNVEASVTGSGLSLIEQSAPCCRPNSGISGQKYYDLNNNGVHDPGEPALSGWTIHLSNGASTVTDGNGFYYFLGLVPGIYTVTESVQAGWTQTAPGGGSYTLTLGTAQQINGQDFGNYRPNNTNCVHIFDCPTNIVAQCTGGGGAVVAYSATATSSCTTNSVTVTFTPPSTTFFPVGTTVVHVTAIDTLDNWSTNCSFTVTVLPGPLQVLCSTNKTVTCGTPWHFDPPTATSCCTNLTITALPPITNGVCPEIITEKWTITDSCGNSNTCTQVVTVVNTGPPIVTPGILLQYSSVPGSRISFSGGGFTFVGSTNVQFEIDDVYNGSGDSFGFDGYFSSGGPFIIGAITINGSVQTAPVTGSGILHITDGANQLTGTIQWVDITTLGTSGVLNLNGQVNLTGIAYAGASQDLQALVASGTAQVNLTFQFIPALTLTQLKATGGLTDYSGSILGAPMVTTPPLISCATNKTVQCGTAWTFDPPTSLSACCPNLTIIPLFTLTNGTGCPRVISQVWEAFDCCSNSVICTQAVTVLDTVPPVITCPSNIVIATCLTNVPVTWSVTATDCSSVTVTSSPPSGTIFQRDTTNTVTAVARDACGNTNTCSFLVIVRRPTLTIAISGSGFPVTVTITWADGGVLQQANSVLGPWTDVPGATSPYSTPATAAQKFYRLRCP